MFDNLTQRLAKVVKNLRGQARLTEDNIAEALREVRMALLEADVALPVVRELIARIKERALGQDVIGSLTPGQALVGVVHQQLTEVMGGAHAGLSFATQPPAVILMAGLQGAGKTTTTGKLGKWLHERLKKKVLTVSCDVYRPAAIDQLKHVAGQAGIGFFPSAVGQAPVAIAEAALDHARRHYFDVLLVDTAGRLHIDEAMMREVAEHVTGKPLKFAGVGEKLTGLEEFHPERMASRILGMGDILSLVEEARRGVDEDKARAFADKLKKGKGFDLNDFREQIGQMRSMGGLSSMMDKLPAQFAQAAQQLQGGAEEKTIRRIEGIICSMTPQERARPEVLKASRKRRIAAGAGVSVQEVNRLLNQFEQTQKMMKQLSRGGMQKLMRGMKGMLPGLR
ncbi:MAG: signal recognition particle protein Srp54 [Betaproteobacteria bacterium]|nr:signal recognition particle protein Srp54 [Betaproteobacteria bacterium]